MKTILKVSAALILLLQAQVAMAQAEVNISNGLVFNIHNNSYTEIEYVRTFFPDYMYYIMDVMHGCLRVVLDGLFHFI